MKGEIKSRAKDVLQACFWIYRDGLTHARHCLLLPSTTKYSASINSASSANYIDRSVRRTPDFGLPRRVLSRFSSHRFATETNSNMQVDQQGRGRRTRPAHATFAEEKPNQTKTNKTAEQTNRKTATTKKRFPPPPLFSRSLYQSLALSLFSVFVQMYTRTDTGVPYCYVVLAGCFVSISPAGKQNKAWEWKLKQTKKQQKNKKKMGTLTFKHRQDKYRPAALSLHRHPFGSKPNKKETAQARETHTAAGALGAPSKIDLPPKRLKESRE